MSNCTCCQLVHLQLVHRHVPCLYTYFGLSRVWLRSFMMWQRAFFGGGPVGRGASSSGSADSSSLICGDEVDAAAATASSLPSPLPSLLITPLLLLASMPPSPLLMALAPSSLSCSSSVSLNQLCWSAFSTAQRWSGSRVRRLLMSALAAIG